MAFSGTAASNRSWVYPYNQHSAPLSAPQPPNHPGPVQEHNNALLNPYPTNHYNDHGQGELHVVNNSPEMDEHMPLDTDSFAAHMRYQPPKKKKSFMGRMFKGVGRIPEALGYGVGAGLSDKRKLKKFGTLDDGYNSSTLTRTDTLPRYTPSASSQAHYDQPHSTLGLDFHPHHNAMDTTIQEYPELEYSNTPPPDVVRLSDTGPGATSLPLRPSLSRRVPPPSADIIEEEDFNVPGGLLAAPQHFEPPALDSTVAPDPFERATVMVYDRDSRYPDPAPVPFTNTAPMELSPPPGVSRPVSSGPGLSYANPNPLSGPPLHPLRPISIMAPAAGQTPARGSVLPLAPINTDVFSVSETTPRASKRISRKLSKRTPTGSRPLSLITTPLDLHPAQFPQIPPIQQQPTPMRPVVLPPAETPPAAAKLKKILSPVDAQPMPTDDYLKMTLSPSSHNTGTASSPTTFSQEPSFTSDLSPFVRFVKTLYQMPWVSHDRVTVDYLPNEGVIGLRHKAKRKKVKPWYNGEKRESMSDLIGGHKKHRHRKSKSKTYRSGEGGYMRTRRRHHHDHGPPSKGHEHHGPSPSSKDPSKRRPVLYPFPYSPYSGFPGFPMPPMPAGPTASPEGDQSKAAFPYQPMMLPPHMYFFPPFQPATASNDHKNGSTPAVLVPGAVDPDHPSHNNTTPSVKTAGRTSVPAVLVPGAVDEDHPEPHLASEPQKPARQSIPGGFA